MEIRNKLAAAVVGGGLAVLGAGYAGAFDGGPENGGVVGVEPTALEEIDSSIIDNPEDFVADKSLDGQTLHIFSIEGGGEPITSVSADQAFKATDGSSYSLFIGTEEHNETLQIPADDSLIQLNIPDEQSFEA